MSHSTACMSAIVSSGRHVRVKFMTILVTGATGNIGRRIVDHLIDLGANDIRALTKNPAKAKLPDGVTPVTGYLGNPESLPAALDGVDRMYLAPLPETLDATLDLAKAAACPTSSRLSGGAHWQAHADTVAASGLVNTQLGPGEFLENFAIWSHPIKATRTVREPYPDVSRRRSRWTTSPGWPRRCWSSPTDRTTARCTSSPARQALTRAQIAEQIGVGIGVDVTFEQCSRAEAEEALRPIMGDEVGLVPRPDGRAARRASAGQSAGRRTDRHAGRIGGALGGRNAELFR